MKLVATAKGAEKAKQHENNVRIGKRSKRKGSCYERDTAKRFKKAYGVDLVRTPQSGGFVKNVEKSDDFRGDIVPANDNIKLKLHIECKNTKSWSLPAWLKQAENDCPKGKIPTVVFHQYGTGNDYVCLSLADFFTLVEKEKIFEEKV